MMCDSEIAELREKLANSKQKNSEKIKNIKSLYEAKIEAISTDYECVSNQIEELQAEISQLNLNLKIQKERNDYFAFINNETLSKYKTAEVIFS